MLFKVMNLYDVTLRDGNHALRHQLSTDFVIDYCKAVDNSGVWAVEIGHGNGLGASSFLVGESKFSDFELLTAARENLTKVKLAVHSIPGFSTIKKNLKPAIGCGVDVFRVATHVTEATVSQKHIEFLAENNQTVHGVLMMSHMADIGKLIEQVALMKSYGASAVIMMDSAGNLIPELVIDRVSKIKESLEIEVGFHAHNNLGVAVSNAKAALDAGATIIDGASMGLGAGAGNAQLENIVANLKLSNTTELDVSNFLSMSQLVETRHPESLPRTTSSSIRSGMAGVFSGYAPQVHRASEEFGIEANVIWEELGKRKLVAGQESMVREIAQDLMNL
jgi:4-hydroxy 2-oxovalerate aldolase